MSPGSVSACGFQAAWAASTSARGSAVSSRVSASPTTVSHSPVRGDSNGPYASSQLTSLAASISTCSSCVRASPAWISQYPPVPGSVSHSCQRRPPLPVPHTNSFRPRSTSVDVCTSP